MLRQFLLGSAVLVLAFCAAFPLTADPWAQDPQDRSLQSNVSQDITIKHVPRLGENPTDEDLRKQLVGVPEAGFNQALAEKIYSPLQKNLPGVPPNLGPLTFESLVKIELRRPDLFSSLPWRMEPDCSLGKESSERLHVLSLYLRDCLRKSSPSGDVRPDPQKLTALLQQDADKALEFRTASAIPTLVQLLQCENSPVRLLLIAMLGKINGKEASTALAQRALFDLSAEVRESAIQTLAKRPQAEYKQALTRGLRYPWPAAADHAAEAIVALKLTGVLPELVEMLREPAPTLPVKTGAGYVMTELVRINHMSNCLLCHAPSLSKQDMVRGRIPIPGEDPPPLYYNESSGIFVRANTTYLRQDFSVVQPVPVPSKWSANQRYDYVVRTRDLIKSEVKLVQQLEKEDRLPKTYPQKDSVLFALRQLTKTDAGNTFEDWSLQLPKLRTMLKDSNE